MTDDRITAGPCCGLAETDEERAVRLRRTICLHEVEVPHLLAGVCKWCLREVVANGCGPGWVLLSRVKDPSSGWRVCSDGMARWFGVPK